MYLVLQQGFLLLLKDFVKLIVIAYAISLPFSYLSIKTWIDIFAYYIPISPDIFIISGIIAIFVALIAVVYNSYKVAVSNPADSLHSE